METPTAQRGIVIRPGRDHDLVAITPLIEAADAKTSLPKEAHKSLACATAANILAKSMKDDRLFIVERQGMPIGYFYVWNACDRYWWIELVCAFVGSATEADVTTSFQVMYEYLFRTKKFNRVVLFVNPAQLFFFTIAHNMNLILEGTLRQLFCIDSTWYDVCLFSQLAEERKPAPIALLPGGTHRYDWLLEQARYDEIQILVVRAVIIRSQKTGLDVLLLLRSAAVPLPGVEELPGGRVDEGESLYEALCRTLSQQTGLQITQEIFFLTSFDFMTDDGQRVREFVFRVHPTTWEVSLGSKEYETYVWLPLPDLHTSKLHPDLIQILTSYSPTIAFEVEGPPGREQEASLELVRPPTPQLEEALRIGHHLDAYAAKGLSAIEPFGLILLDATNRIVGGLSAEIAYGCLTIRRMWIDPSWRRLGWGKKLIARAETFAKEKECQFVTTAVMDWEDIPFFQKLGYAIEYQYTGYERNSRQFRFRKQLTSV